jgi:hypothetical protein
MRRTKHPGNHCTWYAVLFYQRTINVYISLFHEAVRDIGIDGGDLVAWRYVVYLLLWYTSTNTDSISISVPLLLCFQYTKKRISKLFTICVCMFVCVCVCMYVCVLCVCVCVYVCVYVCVCVCMCVYGFNS